MWACWRRGCMALWGFLETGLGGGRGKAVGGYEEWSIDGEAVGIAIDIGGIVCTCVCLRRASAIGGNTMRCACASYVRRAEVRWLVVSERIAAREATTGVAEVYGSCAFAYRRKGRVTFMSPCECT